MGRKVIVAVDDSNVSKDTVKWACKSVFKDGDTVEILSVIEPTIRPDFVAAGESAYPITDSKCQPDPLQLEVMKKFLNECKQDIQKQGCKDVQLTTLVSCIGGSKDAGRLLCDYSAKQNADLLVMGSRGMGSTKKTMLGLLGLGSVSDFVVQRATTPGVLIHKVQI